MQNRSGAGPCDRVIARIPHPSRHSPCHLFAEESSPPAMIIILDSLRSAAPPGEGVGARGENLEENEVFYGFIGYDAGFRDGSP